ncbi:hypothetical protein AB0A69_06955 [Streptomyces sp. NPDC045431]|uniref:hypothetical protein n=1 Tax=Streptomyces sp. NPDC045431 TaxID=3155613 RepID=UPI0033F488C0
MTTRPTESELLAPAVVLEFSDDLRYEDVGPLRRFLEARLAEMIAAQEEGSDGHFAAVRLRDITVSDSVHLADMLSEWGRVIVAGRHDQPGHIQTLRQNLPHWWNRLVANAQHFADHPEYLPRWRNLRYLCVEHAEFIEAANEGMSRSGYDGVDAHP